MTQRKVNALALIFTIAVGLGLLGARDRFTGGGGAESQAPAGLVQTSSLNTQGLFQAQAGASTLQTANLDSEAEDLDRVETAPTAQSALGPEPASSKEERDDRGDDHDEYENEHGDD